MDDTCRTPRACGGGGAWGGLGEARLVPPYARVSVSLSRTGLEDIPIPRLEDLLWILRIGGDGLSRAGLSLLVECV